MWLDKHNMDYKEIPYSELLCISYKHVAIPSYEIDSSGEEG